LCVRRQRQMLIRDCLTSMPLFSLELHFLVPKLMVVGLTCLCRCSALYGAWQHICSGRILCLPGQNRLVPSCVDLESLGDIIFVVLLLAVGALPRAA